MKSMPLAASNYPSSNYILYDYVLFKIDRIFDNMYFSTTGTRFTNTNKFNPSTSSIAVAQQFDLRNI